MRKIFAVIIVLSFLSLSLVSLAVCEEKNAPANPEAASAGKMPPPMKQPPQPFMRENVSVIFGSVTKIDTSNPAATRLEVKSAMDDKIHTIEIAPQTNIAKITDLSELKTGSNVRVMARKTEDKEVAMSVVFGNIKNPPMPTPMTPPPAQPEKIKK